MLVDLSRGLPTPDWSLTYPQLVVFGLALLLMVLDAFVSRRHHYVLLTGISLIGYGLAAAALWTQDGRNEATF
jgi:NADH:ubiquinone oxidoreductase subunit 2 (subunit N)